MVFILEKEEESIEGCEACWWDSNGEQGIRDQPQPVSYAPALCTK